MKRLITLLTLIIICLHPSLAQIDSVRWGNGDRDTTRRGFALGADRDSNEYVIASPFDNWFLGVGAGVQTLIGNERMAEARWNAITPRIHVELGKWVLPDLAVSLRANGFTMMGQSILPLNPYVDMSQTDMLNENGYYPYKMYGWSFIGLLTFDWTNFLRGYEDGGLRRLHILTQMGLGGAWETGKVINPKRNNPDLPGYIGRSWNRELIFHGGLTLNYNVNAFVNLNLGFAWEMARGSFDWSPEGGANEIRMDYIPNITVGAKFNLLKSVRKYHVQSGTSAIAPVYHHFRPVRTYYDSLTIYRNNAEKLLDSLENDKDKLIGEAYFKQLEIDLLKDSLDELGAGEDSPQVIELKRYIDSLQNNENELAGQINTLMDEIETMEADRDSLNHLIDQIVDEDGLPINVMSRLNDLRNRKQIPSTIVFYQIDRSYLDYNAKHALKLFAEKVIKSGDKKTVYLVIGAADKGTGTPKRNLELSIARCNVVYNYLVDECGIDPKQLEKHHLGGITEYGAEGSRMTMVITENKEVNALIEKYER